MRNICTKQAVEVLNAVREAFEPGTLARIELLDKSVARVTDLNGRLYLASLCRDGEVRIEEIEDAC